MHSDIECALFNREHSNNYFLQLLDQIALTVATSSLAFRLAKP